MKRVFAFIGFTVAITLIVLNIIPFFVTKYILMTAAALFIVSLFVASLRKAKVVPVVLLSIAFACALFSVHYTSSFQPIAQLDGKTADITFEMIDLPTEKTDGGYSYTVQVTSIDIPHSPQTFKMKLNTQYPIQAKPYQSVSGSVYFSLISDDAFDSYGYWGNDIYLSSTLYSYDALRVVNHSVGAYILQLREYIIETLHNELPKNVSPLAVSVLTGDKSNLSKDIMTDFKACGISHIIAVSGLHISIICMSIYFLLRLFCKSKLTNTFITLLVLFVYSGIANFSKSVLRAGIMITVLLLAKLINQKADTLNSLGLSVFLICLNPFAVTDISALLTVTAVIGIVVVKKAMDEKFSPKNNAARYIYDTVALSVSVLLTTFPVMWLYFGSVSIMGVFLNLIVIPLVQAALISLALLCVFSKISFLAFIPKAVSYFTLKLIICISDFCADHFSVFFFDVSSSIFGIAAAGILVFIAVSIFISGNIKLKLIAPFMAIVFALSSLFGVYERNNSVCLHISSSGAVFAYDRDVFVAIDVDDKNDNYIYERLVHHGNYDYINLIDCDYLDSNDSYGVLCDNISVNDQNGNIVLTICNKCFEISEDYVTISNNAYVRDLYAKYGIDNDIVMHFASEEG